MHRLGQEIHVEGKAADLRGAIVGKHLLVPMAADHVDVGKNAGVDHATDVVLRVAGTYGDADDLRG